MSICELWKNEEYLAFDDIFATPIFESTLNRVFTDHGESNQAKFMEMLQ